MKWYHSKSANTTPPQSHPRLDENTSITLYNKIFAVRSALPEHNLASCIAGGTRVGEVALTAGILNNNYNSWNDIIQKGQTQRHHNHTLDWTKIHLQAFIIKYLLSDPPCQDIIWHLILPIWRTTIPSARVQENNINLQIIDIINYSHYATLIDVQFG